MERVNPDDIASAIMPDKPKDKPPEVPRIGELSADAVRKSCDASALDINKAADALDLASGEIVADARQLAANIQGAGARIASTIEQFTSVAQRVSLQMREEKAKFEQIAPEVKP